MLKRIGIVGAAWMLFIAVPAMAQTVQKPQPLGPNNFRFEMSEPRTAAVQSDTSVAGSYWLGIECFPVQPAFRSQLNLPEKQGLLVVGVVADSPAAKAGVVQHDILLRAGDKPLGDVRNLIEAVDAAKDGKIKIELLRGGKPVTIEAAPAKRPENARNEAVPPPDAEDWDTVQKWLEQMTQGAPGNGRQPSMQFRILPGPGLIVPKDTMIPVRLPPNTSVSISKSGNESAKIVVKRGNDKWEVTEKELDKLPADLRPSVEQMLGRTMFGNGASGMIIGGSSSGGGSGSFSFGSGTLPPGMMQAPPFTGQGMMMDPQLEKRLEEMDRRMERILELVEKMQEEHSHNNSSSNQEEK